MGTKRRFTPRECKVQNRRICIARREVRSICTVNMRIKLPYIDINGSGEPGGGGGDGSGGGNETEATQTIPKRETHTDSYHMKRL